MGEYDVTIRNRSNGTETTVTVKTANSSKAAENISVAATAVSAAENKVGSPLTKNNVYGKPANTRKTQKNNASLNAEKTKLRDKITGLQSTQNQEELETYRKRVSDATTSKQLQNISGQLNLINTPPEPVSNTKPKSKWEQAAAKVTAKKMAEAEAAAAKVATNVVPPTGGKRRSIKRKILRKARKQRK